MEDPVLDRARQKVLLSRQLEVALGRREVHRATTIGLFITGSLAAISLSALAPVSSGLGGKVTFGLATYLATKSPQDLMSVGGSKLELSIRELYEQIEKLGYELDIEVSKTDLHDIVVLYEAVKDTRVAQSLVDSTFRSHHEDLVDSFVREYGNDVNDYDLSNHVDDVRDGEMG